METTAVINVAEALSRGEKQVLVSIRQALLFLQESPKEAVPFARHWSDMIVPARGAC